MHRSGPEDPPPAHAKTLRRHDIHISAGLVEAVAEYSGETWEGRVDFAVTRCRRPDGAVSFDAVVTRDGEEPRTLPHGISPVGNQLNLAWVVPPGGDIITDGTIVARQVVTMRIRMALLALSAAIRRVAIERMTLQAGARTAAAAA